MKNLRIEFKEVKGSVELTMSLTRSLCEKCKKDTISLTIEALGTLTGESVGQMLDRGYVETNVCIICLNKAREKYTAIEANQQEFENLSKGLIIKKDSTPLPKLDCIQKTKNKMLDCIRKQYTN